MKIVALSLLFATCSMAATVTLTMSEVPIQLIDGLVVSKGGLNFTFANAARTLFYNSSGPGTVTYIQDPSIQGTASQFSVSFSAPVFSVQFGMAELSSSLGQLATVDLFNASSIPFATVVLNATLVDPFAEGLFNFSGGPVTNIRVTPTVAPALAFDNLTVVTAVPEPSNLLLIAGVALLAITRKTRIIRQ
jgi:hypothetical protein